MTFDVTRRYLTRSEMGGQLPGDEADSRPQTVGRLAVPTSVAVDRGRVVWTDSGIPGLRSGTVRVPRGPRLLAEFVLLADASESAIESYAAKYGPLRIGEAALEPLPYREVEYPEFLSPRTKERLNLPDSAKPPRPVYQELVEEWRAWAKCFAAAARLAHDLRYGQVGSSDDWVRVWQPTTARTSTPVDQGVVEGMPPDKRSMAPTAPIPDNPWVPGSAAEGRRYLAEAINDWLHQGKVRPWLTWGAGQSPALVFGGGRFIEGGALFAALSWELALSIGRRDLRTITCSGCGEPYAPLKWPATGQRFHYCPKCKANGIDARDRKRRQRAREERT